MKTTVRDLLREIDDQYCENIHLEKLSLEELAEYKQKLFHDLEVAETIKGNNSYYERIVDYKQKLIGEVERLELEKSADRYYEEFYLERLEEYKQQIHKDLEQYKNIKSMNMIDLLNSVNLAKKVEKELQEIEYWYNGSIALSVENGISQVRELLSCYHEIEVFAENLGNFQSLFQVSEYLNKVKTNVDKGQIEQGISTIESNLKTHSIMNTEEESPVIRKVEAEDIYKKKFCMYLEILRENLLDLKNIENISIGKFIRTLEVADEIKDSIGIMDVWYQQLEDADTRMYAIEMEELLEIHEQFKVLIPYFKGIRPRMKIEEYMKSCDETVVGQEFLGSLSRLKEKLYDREEDYIDDGIERFSNAEVAREDVPVLRESIVLNQEDVEVSGTIVDSLPFNDLPLSVSKDVVSPSINEEIVEGELENTSNFSMEKEKGIPVEVLEECGNNKSVNSNTSTKDFGSKILFKRIQAAREHINNLSKAWTEKPIVELEKVKVELVPEKKGPSIFDDDNDFLDLDQEDAEAEKVVEEPSIEEDKVIHFQNHFEEKKAFYAARRNYLGQLKSLRDQLKTDLFEGLTFQFFLKYKNQYYRSSLKGIQENILRMYGTGMVEQLEADNSIQTLVREINGKLVKLKNDFNCLLETKVTNFDGMVSVLSNMEELSENEFYVIRETIPVMVNAIEKNMNAIAKGKGVVPIRQRGFTTFGNGEKPKKAIVRSSSYHYDTCRMLSETIPEGISPEDFDQICERLNTSLRKKKKMKEDNSDLWIAYKSSVENINSCVRSLKRASSDERVGILQKISKLSTNYVNAYREKGRDYSGSIIQDIRNFFADVREYFYEVLTGDDGFEYEQGYDYTAEKNDYAFYMSDDLSEKIMRDDDLLFMDLDLDSSNLEAAVEEQRIDSSIKNLEIDEAIMGMGGSYTLDRQSEPTHNASFAESEQAVGVNSLSVDQLEQMIKKLAEGQSIDGYNEATDAFQKAIC